MNRFLCLLLAAALVVLPVAAQDDCGTVSPDVTAHLRLRAERLENLQDWFGLLAEDGLTEDSAYELMRWAVLADNAAFKSRDVIYPACDPYPVLDDMYQTIIDHVYALSVQMALIHLDILTSQQQVDMLKLMGEREKNLTITLTLWQSLKP